MINGKCQVCSKQVCSKQGGLSLIGPCPQGALWLHCIYCGEHRVYVPVQTTQIQPGQTVARPKKIGLGNHYGVYLGNGVVFHNEPERGAHYTSFGSFADGRPVWPTSPPPGTYLEYQQILRNAQALAGKPYDLISYNCEDTASEVREGKPKSPTRNLLGITAVGVLAVWLFRD